MSQTLWRRAKKIAVKALLFYQDEQSFDIKICLQAPTNSLKQTPESDARVKDTLDNVKRLGFIKSKRNLVLRGSGEDISRDISLKREIPIRQDRIIVQSYKQLTFEYWNGLVG